MNTPGLISVVSLLCIAAACTSQVPLSCEPVDHLEGNTFDQVEIVRPTASGGEVTITGLTFHRQMVWSNHQALESGEEPFPSCTLYLRAEGGDFEGSSASTDPLIPNKRTILSPASVTLLSYAFEAFEDTDCVTAGVVGEFNGVFYRGPRWDHPDAPEGRQFDATLPWWTMPLERCLYWTQA